MYASKVFQSIRLSTSRLSTAVCSALAWRRVCMMGWTVGKPKLEPWPGRKLCCQAGFEFFDHTRYQGRLPEVKHQIIDMSLNASGVRDTARVLHISTDTVLNELRKKEAVLESVNTAL